MASGRPRSLRASLLALAVFGMIGGLPASPEAAPRPVPRPKKPVVDIVQGEVVELSCYLTDGKKVGEEHEACAREGIAAGQPVGILRSTGTVVLALGRDMKPANELLLPWAAKKVRITGKLVKRAQMTAIIIEKVEEAPADKSKKNRKKPPKR